MQFLRSDRSFFFHLETIFRVLNNSPLVLLTHTCTEKEPLAQILLHSLLQTRIFTHDSTFAMRQGSYVRAIKIFNYCTTISSCSRWQNSTAAKQLHGKEPKLSYSSRHSNLACTCNLFSQSETWVSNYQYSLKKHFLRTRA